MTNHLRDSVYVKFPETSSCGRSGDDFQPEPEHTWQCPILHIAVNARLYFLLRLKLANTPKCRCQSFFSVHTFVQEGQEPHETSTMTCGTDEVTSVKRSNRHRPSVSKTGGSFAACCFPAALCQRDGPLLPKRIRSDDSVMLHESTSVFDDQDFVERSCHSLEMGVTSLRTSPSGQLVSAFLALRAVTSRDTPVHLVTLDQRSPQKFLFRGPHKLLHNSSRPGHLT